MILAMVGVFGILAYSVQQRGCDFGVRRALGATSNDVVRLVVGDAVKVIAIGAAVGLVVSAMLGRINNPLSPVHPGTFSSVTIALRDGGARDGRAGVTALILLSIACKLRMVRRFAY